MNIATLLEIPAAIHPDCEILADTANGTLTYGGLWTRSLVLAGWLRETGVEEGDRVGIFATNGLAYVETIFAIAIAGAIVVPMNYRAKHDEVAHLIRDSQALLVFTEERYERLVAEAGGDVRTVRLDRLDDLRPADTEDVLVPQRAGATACLVYTSGTSSLPKGVQLTHEGLSDYVMSLADPPEIVPTGASLVAAPLYHVAGLTSLLLSLFAGRQVFLLPQFEPGAWLQAVSDHGITQAFLVPTMLAKLLEDPNFSQHDLSTLESISYGAAPMPPTVLERAIDALPHVALSGAYGQTETTSTVTVLDPSDHQLVGTPEDIEVKRRRLRSVGRPLPTVDVRVVGTEGEALPALEVGEVQVRSQRHMAGYWGQPSEETRVSVDDEGWLTTGDIGYLDEDRYLFLVARTGDLIIRGGENIAPQEVEDILCRHPAVAEAAALGVDDEEWGQRVVAAVALRPGATATEEELLRFCQELASYKRPERVVILEELPRTSTGKILRRELPPHFGMTVPATS